MILLYLDESGTPNDPKKEYFVLSGFSVFERQVYWMSREVDAIAEELDPEEPSRVEFHANPIWKGRGRWGRLSLSERTALLNRLLGIVANSTDKCLKVFGAAVHQPSLRDRDPVEFVFEQMCSRFDRYLHRLYLGGRTERGIIVLDRSRSEARLQTLARDFRSTGHTWGITRNIAEVPLFVDSRATRLIQLADIVSYAIYQYYQNTDDTFFKTIAGRFDSQGAVQHGLYHLAPVDGSSCACPACFNRRAVKDTH